MAEIIYKEGCEGQNKLSCIEGIEIDLLNGQKALIYPKYAERKILESGKISKWDAAYETEVEALKVVETALMTECLYGIDSPAAEWVTQCKYGRYRNFSLPSLLAALELQHQKKKIDAIAETIVGADLLRNYTSAIVSCSRSGAYGCWCANGASGGAYYCRLDDSCLVVPTILYR